MQADSLELRFLAKLDSSSPLAIRRKQWVAHLEGSGQEANTYRSPLLRLGGNKGVGSLF